MNVTFSARYQLVARGGPGLSCDEAGVALGGVPLVSATIQGRVRLTDVRPPEALAEVLRVAYGLQSAEVVGRVHRGLRRTAVQLQTGDLAKASLEAVMIGFPDVTPTAMAKLAALADLEKAGTSWQDQPRVPAGQAGSGQWTSGEGGGPTAGGQQAIAPSPPKPRRRSAEAPAHVPEGSSVHLDDGVFHPGSDKPNLIQTAGEQEERGIGDNSGDFTRLEEVFPGLRQANGLAIPIAPVDAFLDISGGANEANLDATAAQYDRLLADIRAMDPTFRDEELQPLRDMSWEARNNVINQLRMERAVDYYKFRGDIEPLQVETLRFLRNAVDQAYDEAAKAFDSGELPVKLSREEAIGNSVDAEVRQELKEFFNRYDVDFGPRQDITINNRDPSSTDQTYRIPDARLGKVSYDWTLSQKTYSDPQIRGFFAADSEPDAVVIVRPSRLRGMSMYLIPRPGYVPPLR